MRYVLALCLCTGSASAQTKMSADEFERYVTGKIFVYGTEGAQDYGVEQYLPNNRVRWSRLDGNCIKGEWYADGPNICFAYEGEPEPHCWTVFASDNGMIAINTDTGQTVVEAREDPSALICNDLFG